jgi:hypothetical protein
MGRTACTEPHCLYKGALYLYLTLYLLKERKLPAGNTIESLKVQIEYGNGEETWNVVGKLYSALTHLTNNLDQLKGNDATLKAENRGAAKNFSFMKCLGSLPRLYKMYL